VTRKREKGGVAREQWRRRERESERVARGEERRGKEKENASGGQVVREKGKRRGQRRKESEQVGSE
jgi:hypothetical protein